MTQTTEDIPATFDETRLTDLEILCYYAYLPGFYDIQSDDLGKGTNREEKLATVCGAPKLTVHINRGKYGNNGTPPGIFQFHCDINTCKGRFKLNEIVTLKSDNYRTYFYCDSNNSMGYSEISVLMDKDHECVANIPEPGTIALMGMGIAGLGIMRRWRKV